MDLIKDILVKHNYVVTFDKLGHNRFLIKTPKRVLEPKQPSREVAVSINEADISIYENGELLDIVTVGEVGVRVALYYILTGMCKYIRYSSTEIVSNNEVNSASSIMELLPGVPFNRLGDENYLATLISEYIEGSSTLANLLQDAKEHNILEEFEQIVSLEKFFTQGERL